MVPIPSFARKDFVFSPRPLAPLGSPSNRFSFIEPDGSQKKKPTSSCCHLENVLRKRGNDIFVVVNILLIIDWIS